MKFDRCPYCSSKLIYGYIKTSDNDLTWSTDPKISLFIDCRHFLEDDVKLGDFR